MIRRTFRGVIQLLAALGAGLAILVVLAAWRLSSGPISLAFLSPYVEQALNAEDDGFDVRFDDTILTWAGWDRTLDVRVLNVRVIGSGGAAVAVVPELSLSLSAQALFRGVIAPRSIELYRPSLQVVRRQDGTFGVGFGEKEASPDSAAGTFLARFAEPPGGTGPTGYLTRLVIREADLSIIDQELGTAWHAPNTEVSLRREDTGIEAEISLNLEVQQRLAHLTLLGGYQRDTGHLDFGIEFADIVPAVFAAVSPKLEALAGLGVPVGGTLLFSMDLDGTVEAVDFDLEAGPGRLDLPAPMDQTVQVLGMNMNGRYDGESDSLEIDELTADLGGEGVLVLPASNGHRLPVRRIAAEAKLALAEKRLTVPSFTAELGGPTVSAAVEVRRAEEGDGVSIAANAILRGVPADDMELYWPGAWGEDAQVWCADHLSDGSIREARAETVLTSTDGKSFSIEKLTGTMELDDFTVKYLSQMPEAREVDGSATFDATRFTIKVTAGKSYGLTLQEGVLDFLGLDKEDQDLDLDLTLYGDLDRALKLIDHEPFKLAEAIGIDAGSSKGVANTRLKMKFPLLDDLTVNMIQVAAASRMTNVTAPGVVLGHGINGGELELRVDNNSMVLSGSGRLGTIPGTLEWRQSFEDDADVRSIYILKGTIDDTQRTQDLGLDFAPFSTDYMRGPIAAEIEWRILSNGDGTMDASFDLSQVALTLPQFNWAKPPGEVGTAEVQVALKDQKVTELTSFVIGASDLAVSGSASFDPANERLQRIDLDKLAFGRTDVKGALIPGRDGGWTVTVHGASFDFAPIFGNLFSMSSHTDTDAPGPDLSFAIDLDQVWVGDRERLSKVQGTLARSAGIWRAAKLTGAVGNGQQFDVLLEPGQDRTRLLTVRGADAGETMRTFGYYENMLGGTLEIAGVFDDSVVGSPLRGQLSVRDFRVLRAPGLTRLLSILSLTGIVDALQGQGLGFAEMEVPFTRHEGIVTIDDARVNGASLGFTASGKVFTSAEIMDIEGTVVPAYAINSALANIPFLGSLFSGGEKGGGVFAATFKMTGPIESPTVTVNPLTVLAPGFVRRLFGGRGDTTPEPESDVTPFPEPEPLPQFQFSN